MITVKTSTVEDLSSTLGQNEQTKRMRDKGKNDKMNDDIAI